MLRWWKMLKTINVFCMFPIRTEKERVVLQFWSRTGDREKPLGPCCVREYKLEKV